ncbi:hypothetical protein VNO77_21283 [Canavalia gladiata]|uniref:Uncharacterized protein n=1 Tax=Canavalia gladiata TaxID=3824 RepID=A0AAN9LR65_CANGL
MSMYVVLNLGPTGLLVFWLMKYADNIIKVYSASMVMLLTYYQYFSQTSTLHCRLQLSIIPLIEEHIHDVILLSEILNTILWSV